MVATLMAPSRAGAGVLGFLSWLAVAAVALACPPAAADERAAGARRGGDQAAAAVHLYISPTTQAFFPTVGGDYGVMLKPWRDFLARRAMAVREIAGAADLAGVRGGTLVVPSAVALDGQERKALLAFRLRGGNILATWATGARDGKGEWLGYGFLDELLGVKVAGDVPPEGAQRFLIPFGDSPVTHSLPAGKRVWLGRAAERLLRLEGAGRAAGRFMDWTRDVVDAGAAGAAILFDEGPQQRGQGRWVAFGFAETVWNTALADVEAVAADALAWLGRTPDAWLGAWPSGRAAAQIIEMDTEQGFPNALPFARMMEGIDAAATFYCLTSVAAKYPDVVKDLARRHEIAYHGEIHVGFKDQPQAEQESRLDRMIADMKGILPDTAGVDGFRAPTEGFDATTEALLRARGIRHHVTDPSTTDARLPFIAPGPRGKPGGDFVVIPRTQRDDINYLREKVEAPQVARALVREFDSNLEMGGLGMLSIHSQNFGDPAQPERLLETSLMTQALPPLLRHARERRDAVWVAPAGQVARWWRQRERVGVTANASGSGLDVQVSVAAGGGPVEGVTVFFTHPGADAWVAVRATSGGAPSPKARPVDRFRTALVFDRLPPGSHRYAVSY
ncbi:MAG: polysaccharide deacetylase family protein [Betaproteobacteria bacterium]|nr:polysaccharide deacetylase family protein [Betaproteobacteria bacterium]